MTNQEFAIELRKIADFYENEAPEDFSKPRHILVIVNSKQEVLEIAKTVKPFKKDYDSEQEYAYGHIRPERFPLLDYMFPRSSVCKKTVSWDCEPLLSPEEEKELEEVSSAG